MRWTAVLCALVLMGCAGEADPPPEDPAHEESERETEPGSEHEATDDTSGLPGDYAETIESETDCERLQEMFNTSQNADSSEEVVAAMRAVDERMREVGCYES